MKLNLKARRVAAIATFQGVNDTRTWINGVYVEPHPDGVVIVATDGSTMGAWLDVSGVIEHPAILRITPKLQAACKGSHRLTIVDGHLVVEHEATAQALYTQEGDWEVPGHFPDYKKILATLTSSSPWLQTPIDAAKIVKISSALSIGSGDSKRKKASLTLRQATGGTIVITTTAQPEFMAACTPEHDEAPYPEWRLNMSR
jgi:hypothetical protein